METAGQLAMGKNWQIVKEPRGFIKLLQFILAIFAFATTCSVSTSITYQINCNITNQPTTTTMPPTSVSFGYPFNFDSIGFQVPRCNNATVSGKFVEGASSSAQFYVFIGVMAFLYSLAAIVFYIFCDDMYRKNTNITIGDFVTTAVFAVFWLISSAAWAQGVSDVKYYTNPQTGIFNELPYKCEGIIQCKSLKTGDFASLNVSIIFGFLNMLVWGGNLWFLYKETPWFKGGSGSSYADSGSIPPQGPVGGSPNSPTAS